MRSFTLRRLLLALASSVPIALAAGAGAAASSHDEGRGKGPAEAAAAAGPRAEAVQGKAGEPGEAASGSKDDALDSGAAAEPADLAADGQGGEVSAETSAEAGVATSKGVEGQAAAEASAGVTETEDGTEVSAATSADTSVSAGSEAVVDSRTISVDNHNSMKMGERSMSMSMTFATLEDGTKVRTKSMSKALALDTPGTTKADARSRADVQLRGDFGGDAAAVSEPDADVTGSTLDSPAISAANGGG